MYKCSECGREIGPIFDRDKNTGRQVLAMFKCPHTGRAAEHVLQGQQ